MAGITVIGDERLEEALAPDPRVLAEQVRMLYARAPIAQATVVVNAFVVCWVFWELVPLTRSVAWVGTLCVLAAARLALVRAYRRRAGGPSEARSWGRRFVFGAALTGVCWGAAALIFYAPGSPLYEIFLAFVLGGMTAGAASSNASYTPAFVAYAAPSLLPMVVRLSLEGDGVHAAMAFMLTLFGAAVAGIGRTGGRTIEEALRLRFRNEALVESLTATQQRLESLNVDLERRVSERTAELGRALALRVASEMRLAVTLRSIGDAVIATDRGGAVTLFNGVAEALTGWSTEDATGRPLEEVFHVLDDGARGRENPLDGPLGEGIDFGPGTRTLVARDGTERTIASTTAPIRDASGDIVGVVVVFRDQTKERRAREALRQSEQRLRALADSMSPLAWTARPDGWVTWYNQRWYEYTGTTLEQTGGWEWQTVHDPATLPDVLRRWKAAIATGTTFEMEFPLRGADGRFRRFLTRVFPLKDAAGEVTQWFGTHTDVTEIVEAHEALRESDRRKDQFIAVLSHELRNPLAPIRSSLYLLEHASRDSGKFAEALEVIHRQTDHLTRLVDDLLDETRISQNKIELRRARIDAREVVRRTCDDYRAAFHDRAVVLRLEIGDPAWIEADETRIAQTVGNLLHNALKFSGEGGTVVVSVGAVGAEAQIRVRDDGIGISADLLPRVFEPFVQAYGGLARTAGGLGLGLALVKGLVELHGGSVQARSEGAGRGAEFILTFPLAPAAVRAEPASTPPPVPGPPRAAADILVIEDNLDSAHSIADVLALHGHRVHVATDGRSGIARARELQPDVILCDIGLPDLDGYEVVHTLRRDDRLRSTLFIALSGYAQPDDIRRAAEAGFDQHISKPAVIDVLLTIVGSALSRSAQLRVSPEQH